jgi:FeS assembly SUF system protein
MSNEQSKPPQVSLPVLSQADKVEQLRREFQQGDGAAAVNPNQTLIDRALDTSKSPQQRAIEEKIIDAIRTVFDPEIPVNVYDLGLIYGIDVSPENRVQIRMTLTAPGCPVAGSLVAEVERKVENIDEVTSATVELVWDPPWSKERMSEAALLELGLL